tara:strand:+ start:254 stop:646 length:393 start_codon:yes stop_codon:yes gene_type:complete
MYPEFYPEFENKNASDIMPYLFGEMAFRNGKEFFSNVLNICMNLPSRFHRWYGDQYSLRINIIQNPININHLPNDIYLKIVRKSLINQDYSILIRRNVKIIIFKGPDTKIFIEQISNNLINYYEQNNLIS